MYRQLQRLVSERWLRVGATAPLLHPPWLPFLVDPGGGPEIRRGTGQALRGLCWGLRVGAGCTTSGQSPARE